MIPQRLFSSEFGRNVLTLFSGTFFAQLLPVLVAPLLSRFFTPDDFGVYEAFTALAAVLAVVMTGRYELAVMLPDNDEDAAAVAVAAALLSLTATIIFSILGILFAPQIGTMLGIAQGPLFFGSVPLLGLLLALIQIFNYWFARRKRFGAIAIRKVAQNGTLAGAQLGAGTAGLPAAAWGLITGQILGTAAGATWFGLSFSRDAAPHLAGLDRARLARVMSRFREFPQKTLPAHLLNIIANQIPSLLFIALFGGAAAGFYALTRRVLATPLSFLAESLTDVFRQRASADYQQHGTCRPIFLRTLKAVSLLSVPPFLIIAITGPWLFAFIFGTDWGTAGMYARILALMYLLRFIASPLSFVLIIAERQNYYLGWQFILFLATIISFVVGWHLQNAATTLVLFSGSYSLLYLFLIFESYRASVRIEK